MEDEKTVSLVESWQLSISKLISKALNGGQISDAEFDLTLSEAEQYHSLKEGLRSGGKEMASEGVDVEAIKQEIKKEYQKSSGPGVRKHKELNIQFSRRAGGFSLFISRDGFTSFLSKTSSLFHKSFLSLKCSCERSSEAVHIAKGLGSLIRVHEISSGRKHETLKC